MSLSGLPNELIVHVFKSVDDIKSAASLSRTSRHFHDLWLYYLPTICDVVIPPMIESYHQASQLLEVMPKPDAVVDQCSVQEKANAAVARAGLLLSNSDMADTALKLFGRGQHAERDEDFKKTNCTCNGTTILDDGHHTVVGVSRTRFLRGYYQAMTVVHLAGKGSKRMYSFLASMDLMEFFRMIEVMEYFLFEFGEEDMPNEDTALPGYDLWPCEDPGDTGPDYLLEISAGLDFLDDLEYHFTILSGIERPINNTFNDLGPAYRLILHSHCVDDGSKKAEGIALTHLLARLPKNISFGPRYELLTPD